MKKSVILKVLSLLVLILLLFMSCKHSDRHKNYITTQTTIVEPGPGNNPSQSAVPEPATITLVGGGLIALAGYVRKRTLKK